MFGRLRLERCRPGKLHKHGFEIGPLAGEVGNFDAVILHQRQHLAGCLLARIILHGELPVIAQRALQAGDDRCGFQLRAGADDEGFIVDLLQQVAGLVAGNDGAIVDNGDGVA